MFKQTILYFLLLVSFAVTAQQQTLPLNREFNLVNQKSFNTYGKNIHTSFTPYIESFISTDSSTLSASEKDFFLINTNKIRFKKRSWMARKLFYENLLIVDTGKLYLTIDPLINLETGTDTEDNTTNKPKIFTNTRGIILRGTVGNKFSFQTSVYETQANLPNYLVDYVGQTDVVPGQGRVKTFKETGFDYNSATANLSYTPAKFINLQLGNGKNFIGDGYRSLLLSDAAYNYPYYKITTQFGKKEQFQYTKLNASLSNLVRREQTSSAEALFTRKSMSVHYLSWIPTKWINIGLFESTLWQTEDSSGTKPFNFQQLNPIIGINTLTTGFNEENHSLIGSNLKIKLPFKTILYNQFVYDGASKFGYQVGAKYFGINNLTLQAEYNNVAPYTYSSTVTLQNYSHFNEPLAHPLGANFNEFIGIINYKYKRFFTQFKMNIIHSDFIGGNVFVSEDQSSFSIIEDGSVTVLTEVNSIKNKITVIQAHAGFLINPKNNMSFIVGLTNREQEYLTLSEKTSHIYFAFRTSLRNLYRDF